MCFSDEIEQFESLKSISEIFLYFYAKNSSNSIESSNFAVS
jgi:hypothetical protein